MKNLILSLSLLLIAIACSKGDDYCDQPNEVFGFYDVKESYAPNKPIILNLDLNEIFNSGQNKTLYSFTVPDIFINPKGDNYETDVVKTPTYTYNLKDTLIYPDSVMVEGYSFNDCGRSEVAKAWIRF